MKSGQHETGTMYFEAVPKKDSGGGQFRTWPRHTTSEKKKDKQQGRKKGRRLSRRLRTVSALAGRRNALGNVENILEGGGDHQGGGKVAEQREALSNRVN